jgi:hypothetical protein
VTIADWAWLLGWALIGAWTVRGLAWWPLAAAFAVAPLVLPARSAAAGATSSSPRPKPNRLNAVVAIILGVFLIAALPWWRPADPLTGRVGLLSYAPSGLAQAMLDGVAAGAHVFTRQTWASWFEWAAPDARYFLDSRFELFPASVFEDYGTITVGGNDALQVLERWDVVHVAIEPGDPLVQTLTAAGWQPMYRDDEGTLLAAPDAVR